MYEWNKKKILGLKGMVDTIYEGLMFCSNVETTIYDLMV